MKLIVSRLALAGVAICLLSTAGFAQAPGWGQRTDSGYQNDRDRRQYNEGLRDGQKDRERGRAYHPRHNEQDYMNGYQAGFGTNGGAWQGRRDDHVYRNPGTWTYGNGRYNGSEQNAAYNNGYQTGLQYGAADRNNGHSFRPTFSSTYQDGTRGYNSAMGSQTAYKQAFRQGYQAGYDAGYNGRQRY